ncbi:glycosyltransferase [Marinicella litoralis]|uniref:GT2 family glycosyltransferase n=1 Tax=Marinicella litoralis TaxID=644220 RepID=A0A4V3DIW0_9GAMM|nr:glycosyltransferase [Marinicella litoralis]TDR23761.1 GT2 family glycosyltransferase [Marinicella litoralis]
MLKNVHQVFYNSAENKQADSQWHTTHEQCDAALFDQINDKYPDDELIVIVNAKAQRPNHWLRRLTEPFKNNQSINTVTALSTDIFALSPLAANSEFHGDNHELDHAIFMLQPPGTFVASVINKHAFSVRNKSHLSKSGTIYVANNLLVDLPNQTQVITGAAGPEVGDQRPLPAHPLATLQWQLIQYNQPWSLLQYPGLNQQPNVLHVIMDWGGGVQKWVDDFIASHPKLNHFILVSEGEFFRQRHGEKLKLYWNDVKAPCIEEFHLSQPITATCESHPEYKHILTTIISNWDIKSLYVSSLIGHAMDCLDTGLPTFRVLHDYFPHWPSLNAQLDSTSVDQSMIDAALEKSPEEPLGKISKSQLKAWQVNTNQLLTRPKTTVIAPNQSVIDNLKKLDHSACYDHAKLIPHGINSIAAIDYHYQANPFKIMVLGRISQPKGQELLIQCIEAIQSNHEIEFVLLGTGQAGTLFEAYPRVKVIKDYKQTELHQIVSKLAPQLALLCSVTSETFSYTLSELQMLGLPVLATRVGAFKDRIKNNQTGFLEDPDAQSIVNRILKLKADADLLIQVSDASKIIKQPTLKENAEQLELILEKFLLDGSSYHVNGNIQPNPLAQLAQTSHLEISRLNNQLIGLEQDLEEKVTWAKALNQQITHLEQNLDLTREEKDRLNTDLKDTQLQAEQLADKIETINKQLNQSLANNNQLREVLEQTKTQVAAKENQIQSMLNSRSWRFTAPLRRFTTYARHKRNAVKFRLSQLLGLPKRVKNSLKTRGLKDTAKLASNKLKKPPTTTAEIAVHAVTENYLPLTMQTAENPVVSVIIPVYNQFKHTYHCLESLARLADKTPFEIIVINDCSTDDTAIQLKKISGITAFTQPENGGFIESCNTGAQMATGTFLLFLNNDTEVLPGWLDQLTKTFETQPDAGLVGSQLIYPDGRLQEAGGIVFADASGWNYGRFGSPDEPEYQHVREVSYCSGASIMIEKQLFNELGQFDQRYKPAYYEDTDLAFGIRSVGKKVYYQPLSQVIHFEGISSGTDLTSGTKKYQVINQEKFLNKWQSALKKQPLPNTDIELARFQNQPKKVLILDACTPTPDQDSGSLRMLNLIQIFKELDYQVSFIPENMAHFDQYTTNLQQLGVECVYAPKYNTPIDYLKAKGHVFDVVILSRYYVAKPLMSSIRSYCAKATLWFDTVDLHYLRELRMAEIAADPQLIKSANKTKSLELAVAKACDLTLVVSPHEKDVLAQEMPELKVDVLSNIHEVFGNKNSFHKRQDIMFIGGYQHTPNVDGLLWFVDEIFPVICAALPEIKLHVIGSKAPQKIKDLGQHPSIDFHGFVEDIDPFMESVRVAVAPLRFGAGVKGKVNMSMSHGQPVVGTKVAVEGMYTTHEKDVMMADDPVQFAQAVIRLYQDEALWSQVSKGGLENVKQWFSFSAAKAQVIKLLESN